MPVPTQTKISSSAPNNNEKSKTTSSTPKETKSPKSSTGVRSPPISKDPASPETSSSPAHGSHPEDAKKQTETLEEKRKRIKAKLKRIYSSKAKHLLNSMIGLVIPISLTMMLTVLAVVFVKSQSKPAKILLIFLPYPSPETPFEITISIGVFILIVCVMTFLMLIVVYYHCLRVAACFIIISILELLTGVSYLSLHAVFWAFTIPVDKITAIFVIYNYAVVGLLAIFYKCPTKVTQGYTILNCTQVALIYIYIFNSPFFVWGLMVALVLWDIFAVLTPYGPLKLLSEIVQEREYDMHIPAMIYKTGIICMAKRSRTAKNEAERVAKLEQLLDEETQRIEEEDDHSMYLGLGDFIFFSLLMGKLAEVALRDVNSNQVYVDWNTLIACYIAILMGLLFTVAILFLCERGLPALPFSIILGLIFYGITASCVSPFMEIMQVNLVFI